ncbi:DUF4340 domain-containing protein [Luteolibacter ambystomatis]|uniref:DUF4340 domain-containing protein n=1 Tax=Luteolibacter ambystomatis TaxID=2824561 RepID=A0A975G5S8_9BACT|nr:DUF4340 domain-containing protein [Luteolibacter ambystomatis]QUE49488.1 DUF4340 domain-containing protein [Luteolibacter ambystomatis]
MRSPFTTFLLALLAVVACGLVGWRFSRGNLYVLFGAPPTKAGELLYPGFPSYHSNKVRKIALFTKAASISDDGNVADTAGKGTRAVFNWDPKQGWMMEEPWKDRMDPDAAEALINFTRGTHVADVIPKDKIDPGTAGFKDGVIVIRMEDEGGQPLCKYLLGRKTAWIGTEEPEQIPGGPPQQPIEVPTVFVRTWDKSRKNYIYACTGDIHALFNDGFRYLRDHHPFYFARTAPFAIEPATSGTTPFFTPENLQHVRLRNSGGELTVAREGPGQPWHIVKPLDLPTDPNQMLMLLGGLAKLRAVKVSDRSSVTLPTNGGTAGTEQIALQAFGSTAETILEILPPATPGAATRLATVSDRPGTVFELPVKAEAGVITLSSLPLTVNALRDSTLTNLNIAAVSGILIQPAARPKISLSLKRKRWVMGEGENEQSANERRLYDLLKAVTELKIEGFVTDAATDFSPWGLDKPLVTIRFLTIDNQSLELAFGRDKANDYFVTRTGTNTVMKINGDIISKIATRPFEWRSALVWSLSKADLLRMTIQAKGKPLTALLYNDSKQTFEAMRNGADATLDFDQPRGRNFIDALVAVQANRWVSEDDEAAAAALADPALTFTITSNKIDETGEINGEEVRVLSLAPAAAGSLNRFYYGRVSTDPNPFVLDQETYIRLAVELFGDRR